VVAGGTLQDVFDRGNPVFAFQPRDQVKPFSISSRRPGSSSMSPLVAADARGNILEAVDSFGQVCLVLLHIFIKPGKVAQGFERRAQLVERGPVLVTAFAAFDGPVHDGAQFAQPFPRYSAPCALLPVLLSRLLAVLPFSISSIS